MNAFVTSLLALVAVSNVLPILPVVHEVTSDLPAPQARAYRLRALLQGNAVGLAFLAGAPFLLAALSLTVNDLRVAGGVILLAFATHDVLFSREARNRRQVATDLGPPVAPLGVPILVGPATLSVLVLLGQTHGLLPVVAAMLVNLAINAGCVVIGDRVLAQLGDGMGRAVGKVMSLVLATLGAGMLRAGLGA